jgi:acetolactate synthase-1/2/3 large subunit
VSYFLKIVWDEILKDNDFSQVNNTTNKQITYKQTKNDWLLHINELKNANKFNYESSGQLKAQDVLIKLNKLIQNKKFVITTGVGNHQMFVSMYINFRNPNCILTSGSSGTMGVCVPYLIGASYTNKNAMLIGIDGDGSFNMSYNELQNIQKYKIPIKLFIMNDGHLQMVRTWQHKFFKGNEIATKSYNPDYSKIAEAWGISYIRIESKTDLENIDLQYKLSTNEPIIFDCKIESTYCLPLVAPGKPLHEMILFEQEKSQQHFDAKDCPG